MVSRRSPPALRWERIRFPALSNIRQLRDCRRRRRLPALRSALRSLRAGVFWPGSMLASARPPFGPVGVDSTRTDIAGSICPTRAHHQYSDARTLLQSCCASEDMPWRYAVPPLSESQYPRAPPVHWQYVSHHPCTGRMGHHPALLNHGGDTVTQSGAAQLTTRAHAPSHSMTAGAFGPHWSWNGGASSVPGHHPCNAR